MTQKKILLAVAIASTGMIFTTGCAKKSENASTRSSASPVIDQEAARAATLATGNSIIEQRFALLRSEALKKASEGTAEQLKAIDDAEAAAVTARDNAVKAKDNAKQTEAEKTLSSLSEQRLVIDRALNHPAKSVVENKDGSKTTIPAGSLVTINADYDKQVKDAKEAFAKALTLTFDGQKEDLKAKPVKHEVKPISETKPGVTPVMVNHEFQFIVAEGQKAANELENDADKIEYASRVLEMEAFENALSSAVQFRDNVVGYREGELSTESAKGISPEKRAEIASSFGKEYSTSLAQLVIESRISFREFNGHHEGGLSSSKCVDKEGCGSQTDGRVGSNAVQSVEKTIADILAARKDSTHKQRIANYLADEVKWAAGTDVKKEIADVLANLEGNSMGWEAMADAICTQSTVETKTETKEVVNALGTKSKRPVTTKTDLSAQQVVDRALGKAGNYLGA